METREVRQKFLDFYKKQKHEVIPSASLLPENDPTTLFTGSGMQPMVPYLLGEKHPKGVRLVDSQKCFRAQDIEEVGDNRHTTFFEMLGNWSLGDYFKKEQIPWMFSFLVNELKLDPKNIYVTCFIGNSELGIDKDEESVKLWQEKFKEIGIDAKVGDNPVVDGLGDAKIFFYDETKNWWSRSGVPAKMPEGEPGGPDSEMFWDFAPEDASVAGGGIHKNSAWAALPCHVNCDCGRFMEIGNNVFMEYKKVGSSFEKLSQQNVDQGSGLERMVAATINNSDVFMIDAFESARKVLEDLSDRKYGGKEVETKAFRVVLDHIRAATFLISDRAYPSNKDQGYFTRRLIRRSIRYAANLGIQENFCGEVAKGFINTYKDAYKNLENEQSSIVENLSKEEEKFRKALKNGAKEYDKQVDVIKKNALEKDYAGLAKIAFDLYQTHGLPVEVFTDYLTNIEVEYDEMKMLSEFDEVVKAHQELSRAGAEKKFHGGLADHSEKSVRGHTATHLLHAALRQVLGSHVQQKGSNITPERVRFDFNHESKLTEEQIKEVEDLVNGAVEKDYPVSWHEMTVDEAYKKNAIGFFPERYDEVVKVYTIGDPEQPMLAEASSPTFSQEICGGPHVEHTSVVGKFTIAKEEALGDGLRRIKAVLK